MLKYYSAPFPFYQLIGKKKQLSTLPLEISIRNNIRMLVMTRLGEFTFDPKMGFEMWEHDRRVFYQEKEPYYVEKKESSDNHKGLLENTTADKNFTDNLKRLVIENELRLEKVKASFSFKKVDGNRSVYQRHIMIKIEGTVKNTGKQLQPAFIMEIFYSPFRVENN